ncbi:MAG: hypothetical protein ACI8PT_003193, partial [Gammaproteobacteria bacterium]
NGGRWAPDASARSVAMCIGRTSQRSACDYPTNARTLQVRWRRKRRCLTLSKP